jgi:hypothetical protein
MTHALTAPDLWTAARRMLGEILCIAGAATAAAIVRLSRREREGLRAWVVGLEAMVRKLLLIEADRLGPPASLRHGSAAQKEAGADAGGPRNPSFHLLPAAARQREHSARIRQLGPSLLVRDLWRDAAREARIARLKAAPRAAPYVRIANRIAALARVIARPAPHARRLARVLAKAAGATFDAIVSAPARHRPMAFQAAAFDEASARTRAIDRARFLHRR